MFIFTTKLSKFKLLAVAGAAVLVVLLVVILANRSSAADITQTAAAKLETPESRVEYLSQLGYTVAQDPVKTQEVRIPKEFTEVYEQYNALQKNQGFDLSKYRGKGVMQYVYQVENYPDGGEEPVYATLLLYKGKLIGGDLSRGGADGFLRPLLTA